MARLAIATDLSPPTKGLGKAMRGHFQPLTFWLAMMLAISTSGVGCSTPAKRSIRGSSASSSSEPALTAEPTDSGVATVVEPPASSSASASGPSAKQVSIIDRHPLLRKPQQYYDNTKSNKAVKTAAAAFVGVPSGLFGELKQIVVGTPSSAPPAY